MPQRSSVVLQLAPELRLQLDGRIIEAGFGGYAQHAVWLEGQGHRISVSALQRYGKALSEQLSPPQARIRLNTATRARLRTETARRGSATEVAESALDLAEEGVQEYLHAKLESGESFGLDELQRVLTALADAARARGTLARARTRAPADAPDRVRRGVSAEGERAIRAAVEGAPE